MRGEAKGQAAGDGEELRQIEMPQVPRQTEEMARGNGSAIHLQVSHRPYYLLLLSILSPPTHVRPYVYFPARSRECAIIGQIQCNGQNRFACFSCDYDACDSCARRKISQSRQRDRGRTTGRRTGSVRSAASAAAATAASVSWEEEEKERTSNSSEANPEAAKSAAEAPMRPLLSPGAVLPGPTYHRFDESDMEEGPLLPPSYDEAMTQNLLHS